jgi:hypothetical protein
MKNLVGWFCISILCGCALQQRKVAIDRQATSSELAVAETEKLTMVRQHIRTDSSAIETSIELFPKGKFSYSPDRGFEGEADRIVITGKAAEVNYERSDEQVAQARQSAMSQRTEQEHAVKLVESQRISFLWLGITAAGVVLVVYAYHRFRLRLKHLVNNIFKKKRLWQL